MVVAGPDGLEGRPAFWIGQHDPDRSETTTYAQHGQILASGFNFLTTPITNHCFHARVVSLYKDHLKERERWRQERGLSAEQMANASLPGPFVSALTDADTSFFPGAQAGSLVACSSPWVDLCSPNPVVSTISRQVLNLEVAYANFCGARGIMIPGPSHDGSRGVAQYARAIQEALRVATRANLIVHVPMYREPGLGETAETLSALAGEASSEPSAAAEDADLFGSWNSWHTIRTVCQYSSRLFVALRIPKLVPEKDLQDRWFAEPLHYLTLNAKIFRQNKAGYPALSTHHQDLINRCARLKNTPWLMLIGVGPDMKTLRACEAPTDKTVVDFPTLAAVTQAQQENRKPYELPPNAHVSYMRHLERSQLPFTAMESPALTNFQDWLQSPLQPLADNLESATYEMFEGDPVKYNLYEQAIAETMREWRLLGKPTSSVICPEHPEPELVVAVAGAGRGPLVARALRAAEATGTKIQVWALEKNQNAYVYLVRRNRTEWGGRVTIVKTDMRGWEGPRGGPQDDRAVGKVDILISELLGSFGDNELSPECIDGVERHLARPHGVSVPRSYTAHLSPIATPRIHADLSSRVATAVGGGGDPHAFATPWVVRLFAFSYAAARGVPGHARFQRAWEFAHPAEAVADEKGRLARGGGNGSMFGAAGANEHNARHCHLTFVCRTKGVVHGLAGYFESVLYAPAPETESKGGQQKQHSGQEVSPRREPVELSILPEQIDRKSKNMISWFPIFFPLKEPLYYPPDTELDVSMWRQTDDTKVWYEWMVEAFMWTGPKTRVKVGASELHSSYKVACLM